MLPTTALRTPNQLAPKLPKVSDAPLQRTKLVGSRAGSHSCRCCALRRCLYISLYLSRHIAEQSQLVGEIHTALEHTPR